MKTRSDIAEEKMLAGYNCAQAVLYAFCEDLLTGRDLNTPEGQRSFKENDCLHKTCIACVRAVVETVEELL